MARDNELRHILAKDGVIESNEKNALLIGGFLLDYDIDTKKIGRSRNLQVINNEVSIVSAKIEILREDLRNFNANMKEMQEKLNLLAAANGYKFVREEAKPERIILGSVFEDKKMEEKNGE